MTISNVGNKSRWIVLIFLISIIVYGIAVSFFTSTVHVGVDEELYVALARSFHYTGKFEYGNQIMDYNCVLYSMMISVAYFFYTPQNILFVMRMIGVISMCSAIFPIYFLARNILRDERKAVLLSGFSMILPYMFDCAYIMQEVLSYPLFLWTIYFLYLVYEKENQKGNMIYTVMGSVFSVLCVFTKTYMFFIPIVVNLCAFYDIMKRKNKKKYVLNTIIYDVVYFGSFIGMYFMVFAINGFEKGSNHYTSQFSHLFPISVNTVIYGLAGCIIYAAFFVINTGIFPMGIILHEWKLERGGIKWPIRFLLVSVVFMIFEIVFMIFLTEEGTGTLPHKFLFRYFHIFVPLILILFVKYKENMEFLMSGGIRAVMIASLCIAGIYFLCMQGKTREAIIDGHLFLFVENISKYIVPYADVVLMALLLMFLLFILWLYQKKENKRVMNYLMKIGVIGIAVFWMIEIVQLPLFTNIIADGRTIESDSVKIAQYLNQEGYEQIYYVYSAPEESYSYIRNFYGYIMQPYEVISEENMDEILELQVVKPGTAFLFSTETEIKNDKLECVSLDTERLALCIPVQAELEK